MQKATIYKIKDISTLDEYYDVKEKYIGIEILISHENPRLRDDD